ncbi:hypothetical protein Bca4012_061414 [Brassica carinata]
MSDEELESTNVKDSKSYPQEAGTIRKNDYIVIKGRPCKVVETSTSETGECHFAAIDIFTSVKLEDIVLSSHNCDVPRVNCTDYTLLYIFDDGFVSVLTENGTTKDDLKLPTDEALLTQVMLVSYLLLLLVSLWGEFMQLKAGFEEDKYIVISVMSAMGEEKIIALKEDGTKGGD